MEERAFLAHIRSENGRNSVQTVSQHCRAAAAYASEALQGANLANAAYLAGLLHDLGKTREAFTRYLIKASSEENVRRGSVNHTFAGVRFLLEQASVNSDSTASVLCAETLAYAVGAHHGLFDIVAPDGKDGFLHRLETEGLDYDEAVANFEAACAGREEVSELFAKATEEIAAILKKAQQICSGRKEGWFYLGLLARLILSSVIEGDRRDTAEFMLGKINVYPEANYALWKECLTSLESRISAFKADTEVNKARRAFSEQCATLGSCERGLYRLCLPTGGGKTLASLRGALAHAAANNMSRIIYVIPLLSVLDQNADIIRDYINKLEIILEHHSNLLLEKGDENELDEKELLMENWQAPFIITTLVQMLNTLFDGRTSCVRRMQALCNSVIVFDEVQSVPPRFLSLFHSAVNFLTEICGATVILCSATIPSTEKAAHGYCLEPKEIVPYNPDLWKPFNRTKILPPVNCKLENVGELLKHELNGSLLVVCNTRFEAAAIYRQLDGVERYHLSASMCVAHRREVLKKVETAIREGRTFICVSTQLIECGVDVSFKKAARIMAGLDNEIQTAGRCNRHGEFPDAAEVITIRCVDENLKNLPEIRDAQKATEALFDAYARNPSAFDESLSSERAIQFYYSKLFGNMLSEAQDGPLPKLPSLYELLSTNEPGLDKCKSERNLLAQAFATAGNKFEVFPDNTYDVLVPWGEGKKLITDIGTEKALNNLKYTAELLRRAKPYTVAIYQYQKDKLSGLGALYEVNGILALRPEWYSREYGLTLEGGQLETEELII